MNKILYLVKMGWDYDESTPDMVGSDVGNYRIRGTFHDSNNNLIFAEFGNGIIWKVNKKGESIISSRIGLRIDHLFNATQDWDENQSHIDFRKDNLKAYRYTKADILKYIYKKFKVRFESLELIDCRFVDYDYKITAGDEVKIDIELIKQNKKIYDYFYNYEKNIECKRFPNFSMYYESGVLTVTKHYNGFNDYIKIENPFEFNFDYKIPEKVRK